MDKRQELLKKLHLLVQEIDKDKEMVDDEKKYLNNYENIIEVVIKKLQDGTLPASKGGLIGTMRGISQEQFSNASKLLRDRVGDVRVRNGVIDNARVNDVPRTWDSETGLYNNTKKIGRYIMSI